MMKVNLFLNVIDIQRIDKMKWSQFNFALNHLNKSGKK